jgi:hypothetical protein
MRLQEVLERFEDMLVVINDRDNGINQRHRAPDSTT